MTDPRFPIGRFSFDPSRAAAERTSRIAMLARAAAELRGTLEQLHPAQLELSYRDGGWTVRQLVHHLADSHMLGFLRCKLALTEREPALPWCAEDDWAQLAEGRTAPVEFSLTLLEGLHERWAILLGSLEPPEFARTVWLPQSGRSTLDELVALYAWHARHHMAQIAGVRTVRRARTR